MFLSIALSSMRVWRDNPRRVLGDITDLTASVQRSGVLEPLLVRPVTPPEDGITHEVIAGQRRYRAASAAGMAEVPCLVRDVPDDVALEMALVENSQRTDVSPLEEAEAIERLVREHGRTVEAVADKLGRTVAWVRRRLSLLTLCEAARERMRAGTMPLAHAFMLAAIDHDAQARMIERFAGQDELPAARSFAHELTYLLHMISSAPFDVDDEKLPGGSCAKCMKRSDAQPDLFATGREPIAHCLDAACWDKKVAVNIERARADAAKRHLPVLEGDASKTAVGTSWDGRIYDQPDSGYVTRPSGDEKPVAVAVTDRGRVVDLYAKPSGAPVAATTPPDDESDEPDARDARAQAERDAQHARYRSRLAALAGAASTEALVARVALRAFVLTSYAPDTKRMLTAFGLKAPGDEVRGREIEDAIVAAVPDEQLVALLLAVLAWERFSVVENSEEEPATFESALFDAMKTEPDTTRINGLAVGDRTTLDGIAIEVLGVDAEGFVWRTVDDNPRERDEGDARWGEVQESDDGWETTPIETSPETPYRRKKMAAADKLAEHGHVTLVMSVDGRWKRLATREKGENSDVWLRRAEHVIVQHRYERPHARMYDRGGRCTWDSLDEEPPAPAEATPPQRVIIVSGAGDDWMGARKGLAAWQADKTRGAGASFGGSAAPLVMLHTPALDSGDIEKLLARYAKVKRPVLDIGVVPGDQLEAYDPGQRAVRERWNAAHPAARVPVPEEKPAKKARTKKGGAA